MQVVRMAAHVSFRFQMKDVLKEARKMRRRCTQKYLEEYFLKPTPGALSSGIGISSRGVA